MADEFVNFDSALNELGLTAEALKRLVSEGEIRAVRGENDSMRFRRDEIERLKKQSGKGRDESSDTLTDDLLFDEADDLEVDDGMATAQISSEDTFVGDAAPKPKPTVKPAVKATVAPKGGGKVAPKAPAKGGPAPKAAGKPAPAARPSPAVATPVPAARRTTGRSTRMLQAEAQKATGVGMGMVAVMGLTAVACLFCTLIWLDISKDQAGSVTKGIAESMVQNFAATELPGSK